MEEECDERLFLPVNSEVCCKCQSHRLVCLHKEVVISSGAAIVEDDDFATPDPCAEGGCCSIETPSASSQGNLLVVESVGGFQVCSSDYWIPLSSSVVCRPVEDSRNLLPGMQDESVPEAGDLLVSPAAAWVSTR